MKSPCRFEIKIAGEVLCFFSMTTVFGTPVDVMLSELALELFFPADDTTAEDGAAAEGYDGPRELAHFLYLPRNRFRASPQRDWVHGHEGRNVLKQGEVT